MARQQILGITDTGIYLMLPIEEATQAAQRALSVVELEIGGRRFSKKKKEAVFDRIDLICRGYIQRRENYRAESLQNFRNESKSILEACSLLLENLYMKRPVRSWYSRQTRKFLSIAPDYMNHPANKEFDDGELLLAAIVKASALVDEIDVAKGARQKTHISTAVSQLVALWNDLRPDALFKRTFEIAKGVAGDDEFVNPAAQFVHRTITAIDSDLGIKEVLRALKDMSVKAKKV